MKVILLEDVKGTGKKGDIVNVKDGYCSNFLLPKKLALPANKQNINVLEKEKERALKHKETVLAEARAVSEKISGKSYTLFVKAGEGERLFGSVTHKEIAEAVEKETGIFIDKKKISANEHLKTLGEHNVSIKLHPEVEAAITIVLKPIGEK